MLTGAATCLAPLAAVRFMWKRWGDPHPLALSGIASSYLVLSYGAISFLMSYGRQDEEIQMANLDSHFENAYREAFIHADAEDLRSRWQTVKPTVVNILRSVGSA